MQGFTQIGYIVQSHGLNGELNVSFETQLPDAVKQLKLVYLRNDRGDFYPARITNVRLEEKRNSLTFFVQFDHIADRSAADALKSRGLYLETKNAEAFIKSSGLGDDDSLIDCEIRNEEDTYIGMVTEIMDNPAHPILVVATTSGRMLIPCVDHFVTDVGDQIIYCQNLDLLEDL
ncbi:MAG: 16S rRNA processing protein RimM [Balneolaceae bacterium]|nr:16S rRNA processing protein RimM [Balneolaceae bacterium]